MIQSPKGVAYTDTTIAEAISLGDFSLTRELLRCNVCENKLTLDEAKKAANLPTGDIYWASTDEGIKVPLVCPKCNNHTYFTSEELRVTREHNHIEVVAPEPQVKVVGIGGDPVVEDTLVICYKCDVSDCDGVIDLRPADYNLVRSS